MSTDSLKPAKKLGFGLMRLPLKDDDAIDLALVCQMVDAFMQQGFTYFDTAYVYHDGKSESLVKKALVERYPRDAFTLATKLPGWLLNEQADVQRIFDEQLARAGVEYFDYYLLHSMSAAHLKAYDKYNCWDWARQMKATGRIRHFGFSFHDSPELLEQILNAHPEVEFVQLQINYLDWDNEKIQSRRCYEIAAKHQLPVIIMEPVKGGLLANLPAALAGKLQRQDPQASLASWALRYCASLDNVLVVLSGMSDLAQMTDNLQTFTKFSPLSPAERAVITRTAEQLRAIPTIACTGCRYCVEGCPQEIPIPDLLDCVNNARVYDYNPLAQRHYNTATQSHAPASACIACGQCEEVCPQHLNIIGHLQEAAATFEKV